MNIKNILCNVILITAGLFQFVVSCDFPPAPETYQALNADPEKSFVASFGTAMSQTHTADNTPHHDFICTQLQKLAYQSNGARTFLANPERIWYLLRSLPSITCAQCQTTLAPDQLNLKRDKKLIANILTDLAQQKTSPKLTITRCPQCLGPVTLCEKTSTPLSDAHRQAMVDQINFLGLKNQKGCKRGLPPYRLSIEACSVMHENSEQIDPTKVAAQAEWLKKLGNPFIFLHHYANPRSIPNLFEKEEHISWFAKYCAQVMSASPEINYVCPISQPIAFSFRVTRQNLPPFTSSISQSEYFKNIIKAHVASYDAIKKVNPAAQVFVSHQWKPMKPMHSLNSPLYYAAERLACAIANKMYNQSFVDALKNHTDKFDGLAISVYPPMYFNGFKPCGDNCNGVIDAQHSLESIMEIHKAFPTKKIIIVETGCNHPDTDVRKKFMDMTLDICLKARKQGVDICGVYFWGHTNHPDFYREWNTPPGSTHFGMFDDLNPQDPNGSINAAGKYLQEIVRQR